MIASVLSFVGFFVAPVGLISLLFENRLTGVVVGVVYALAWHATAGLILQALGLFVLPTLIGVHVVGLLIVSYMVRRGRPSLSALSDWRDVGVMLLVICIAAAHLYQVHFNYTGDVSLATRPGSEHIESMRYPYPYFSDEWYAVAFIKDSIATQSLPARLPFTHDLAPFVNYEAVFHSTIGELIVTLGLNPVTQYTVVAIGVGALICGLLYALMRVAGAGVLASLIASLSALYLTNSANLPGLWTLLPIALGCVFFLATLFALKQQRYSELAVATLFTLLMYPPLVLLLGPAFLTASVRDADMRRWLMLIGAGGVVLTFFIVGSFFWLADELRVTFARHLSEALFYTSYTPDGIPSYAPWHVVPMVTLIGSLVGIGASVYKRSYEILAAIAIGTCFWLIYANVQWRVLIDYQRIVFVTSLLLTVFAALGLNVMLRLARTRLANQDYKRLTWGVLGAAIIVLAVLYPSYTDRSEWKQLVLNTFDGKTVLPKAPANNYLTPEDLELFADIMDKRFLSLPWKGTVVGVATGNHPVTTKAGTITLSRGLYGSFMEVNCKQKQKLSRRYELDFVYSEPFRCGGFKEQATSSEGLRLYKVHGVGRQL